MYLPKAFEESRPEILHALIRANPLGIWAALVEGRMQVNHLPLLLHVEQGTCTLQGHVARPNPVAAGDLPLDSIVTFQGPEAYITPGWYPGKAVDGKVVPTWNYVVVHAHGEARLIRDKHWLLQHVTALTDAQEASRPAPWRVSDAPATYIERMLAAIVGVEIRITRLEGKWKTSQNRDDAERAGVVKGLLERGDESAVAMAALVRGGPAL